MNWLNHGTLLLDEVTEMKPTLQAKLLRVLQESQIDRVGGESSISVDVRIIATTNQDVYKMIEQGKFREDLFFRLNVISLKIPPLRKRPSDIELLSKYFLEKYSTISEKKVTGISEEAIKLLKKRKWKGNVRELENAIERAVLLTQKSVLTPEDFSFDRDICNETIYEPLSSLKEMEKKLIAQALKETEGNRTRAAKILGISVRTLRNKLNEYKDLA
ncbi:Regulatory protein AtoC [Candidatus Methanoperedenaceae archaeon GB50]|nr:Regulatory protein AtoC [Candidatus Methanoperedenaceae archaeon GB50]